MSEQVLGSKAIQKAIRDPLARDFYDKHRGAAVA